MADVEFKNDPFPLDRDLKSRHDWFAKQLGNKPREDCILLAARASLRSLPRAKISDYQSINIYITETLRFNIIAILLSFGSASQSVALWDVAADSSVVFVTSDVADTSTSNFVTTSAFMAVNAAGSSPEKSAAVAAEAINYATAASDTDSAVNAFQVDLWQLDGTISARERLAVSMLWPRGGIPNKSGSDWREFMDALVTLGDGWEVWTQWYYGGSEPSGETFTGVMQGARDGKYLFGLPTARALKLWHDVALIDDAMWKGDPAALNAEFKRLVDEARAETIAIAHKAMLDRIAELEKELQVQKEKLNRPAVIGHNNPPESIEGFAISETEWTEVKEAIKSLKEQPPQPKDGGESAKSAVQKLKAIVSKGSAYLLTEAGKEIVKQAIKESWPTLGVAGGAIIAGVKFLIDAALHWLSLLN